MRHEFKDGNWLITIPGDCEKTTLTEIGSDNGVKQTLTIPSRLLFAHVASVIRSIKQNEISKAEDCEIFGLKSNSYLEVSVFHQFSDPEPDAPPA